MDQWQIFTRRFEKGHLPCLFGSGYLLSVARRSRGKKALQTVCSAESEVRCLKRHRTAWSDHWREKKHCVVVLWFTWVDMGKPNFFKSVLPEEEASIYMYRLLCKNKEKVRPKGESKGGWRVNAYRERRRNTVRVESASSAGRNRMNRCKQLRKEHLYVLCIFTGKILRMANY